MSSFLFHAQQYAGPIAFVALAVAAFVALRRHPSWQSLFFFIAATAMPIGIFSHLLALTMFGSQKRVPDGSIEMLFHPAFRNLDLLGHFVASTCAIIASFLTILRTPNRPDTVNDEGTARISQKSR